MAQAQIRTVAVVGCGVIGMSWATLFLAKGLKVIISDPAPGAEESFKEYIHVAWPSFATAEGVEKALLERYEFVDDIEPRLAEADFIQENGPERIAFKEQLIARLDAHTRPEVIIASSSSGLPSSAFIGTCTVNPSRVLIGHPFNPPHLIPLVEVVPHSGTSAASVDAATAFYTSLGKTPIVLRREVPGFVANRLQAALNSEAYSLISRGVVSAEDLDTAVTAGPGLRWGIAGPIATNALGGGGGVGGFAARLDRLEPAIRGWERDMAEHRFDWSEERVKVLREEAERWLAKVDWKELVRRRDEGLLMLLAVKRSGAGAESSSDSV